jgi:ankyrin repeat protein
LLAAGASPHARDDDGATVLQYAERVAQQTAAQLLLAAGAQPVAAPSHASVGGEEAGGAAASVMWASTSSKLRTWGSERTQRFEKLLADKAYS